MRRTALFLTVSAVAVGAAFGGASITASALPQACPPFTVLHNDKIGTVPFPAGPYNITALKGETCQQAAALFAQFLQDWDGNLPGGWAR